MSCEQVFDLEVDTERLFVLNGLEDERMFGKGDTVSVAFDLEYEVFRPPLRLVTGEAVVDPNPFRVSREVQIRRRRLALVAIVAVLLVLLMLPIRALGGATLASTTPSQGQHYVVKAGDSLASIARQADPANPTSMVHRLVAETGSDVVVPGEHLLIP
ncbi:MAG TPA: LysM domain-containing protein [Acidimicrobiales bacterium]|jgi:hypothetical protein